MERVVAQMVLRVVQVSIPAYYSYCCVVLVQSVIVLHL